MDKSDKADEADEGLERRLCLAISYPSLSALSMFFFFHSRVQHR